MFLKNIRSKKIYLPILFVTAVLLSTLMSVFVFAADGVTVNIDNCGSRLVAHVENASTPTYQWQVAETEDGTYSDIDGAAI